VIEVWDGSPLDLQPRQASADDECGRGLAVVAALSARWGCERDGRRKVVWAELALCGCKKANVKPEHNDDWGDAWTFVCIDADTKLVPSWYVGQRCADDAFTVLSDLRDRLVGRMQLSTDGHSMYLSATADAFDSDLDYAMVVKEFRSQPKPENTKHSPAPCKSVTIKKVSGSPDPAHISTSYVERQNLTIRMSMRRFTRLTNAFSRKLENLTAVVSLHFMFNNFGRPHQTLTKRAGGVKTTPAMAAGVADHVWSLTEIAVLLDSYEHSN
jgi:hypothetical protein